MAATAGIVALGTDIQIKIDAAYYSILEPKDISGPQITFDTVDFTTFTYPVGWRKLVPTFKSSGQISFRVNYVHTDSTQQGLVSVARANPPTLTTFRLIFPDESQFDFEAYVSVQWQAPVSGALDMAVNLLIYGDVEITLGSPSVSPSSSKSPSPSPSLSHSPSPSVSPSASVSPSSSKSASSSRSKSSSISPSASESRSVSPSGSESPSVSPSSSKSPSVSPSASESSSVSPSASGSPSASESATPS